MSKLGAKPHGWRRKNPEATTWDYAAETDLLRHVCRSDFWSFFLYAFGGGLSPKGQAWVDPAVHEPLARWYQKHVDDWLTTRRVNTGSIKSYNRDRQKNLAIVIHREVGKSRMITAAGQMWLHLRDPEMSTYTGSESLELSSKILEMMKAVYDGTDEYALFARLYGAWSGAARKWTGRSITHSARKQTSRADPSHGTFAVETSITGAHPDAIFYDDPISYERLQTDTNWLSSVNSQVTSLFPVIQGDGLVVWVGTRYDADDHFGKAFELEGVASLAGMQTDSIPVDPKNGIWHVYFLCGRDSEGRPTTPKVWPEARLSRYQKREPLRYAAQVMNDPSISETNPITKEQIEQCWIEPKDVPWSALRLGICCDVAFSSGQKHKDKCDTVFVIHGYPSNGAGDVYVVEVQGSKIWRAEDMAKTLVSRIQVYRRRGFRIIGISDEDVAGRGNSWELALRNFFADANEPMPPFFLLKRQGANVPGKFQRMVTASTFWVHGHVKVVKGAIGAQKLMDQMTKIGNYKFNPMTRIDYVDAHADAFDPNFYQPMRRAGAQKGGYDRGARPITVDGIEPDDWARDSWYDENPRPPI